MKKTLLIELFRENKSLCNLIEQYSQEYGINHIQLFILILSLEDKMNVSNLAIILNITKSAVSQALVGLVLKRLIIKKFDDDNKKIFYIDLTNKGKKITNELLTRYYDLKKQVINKLGNDEFNTFVSLLDRFNQVVNEVIESREDLC